jgi:hypothetical protein
MRAGGASEQQAEGGVPDMEEIFKESLLYISADFLARVFTSAKI